MEYVIMGIIVMVLVALFFGQRFKYLESLDRQQAVKKGNACLVEQLKVVNRELADAAYTPRIVQLELKSLDNGILASYLAPGPDSPLWMGVEECCRRVMAADQAGSYDTPAEKAAAMDHLQGASDVIAEMRRWHQQSTRQQANG